MSLFHSTSDYQRYHVKRCIRFLISQLFTKRPPRTPPRKSSSFSNGRKKWHKIYAHNVLIRKTKENFLCEAEQEKREKNAKKTRKQMSDQYLITFVINHPNLPYTSQGSSVVFYYSACQVVFILIFLRFAGNNMK